jgi:hypothetical protein
MIYVLVLLNIGLGLGAVDPKNIGGIAYESAEACERGLLRVTEDAKQLRVVVNGVCLAVNNTNGLRDDNPQGRGPRKRT